jgi:site-specific DNA recombinase
MKTAAIYARVSSDQQREDNTIASQTAALKEFAAAHGFAVPEDWVFEDAGYSGASLVRPGLERIRDLAAEGHIQAVLVHAPDRLSRKYAYQVLLTEELSRHGVETVFIKAPQSATPEDQLLVQFQGMIAEYERAQILERSRRGKRHRAKAGEVAVLGTAPYGYRYVKKTDAAPARFEVIAAEATVVRLIFEQYTVVGLSIGAVARLLNAQGVPTRRQAPRWERSTVWGVLRNPAYQGTACFGKTQTAPRQRVTRPLRLAGHSRRGETTTTARPRAEWIEIPIPPLVSEDTFALAAQRLADNKRFAARRTIEPSLVQGMVVCKKCGYALSRTSTRSSARKIHYYRCIGSDAWRRLSGPVCDSRPIRQDLLDQVVWTEVVRLLEDPTLITAELDRRLAAAHATEPTRRRQEALERERVQASKAMERLVTAYQEDLLSLEELRRRMPDLRRREQGATAQLRAIADQTAERTATLRLAESLSAFLTRLRTRAQTLDIHERQRIVRLLVKEVLVADNTIVIRHAIPVHASHPGDSDPPPPPPEGRSPSGDQDYLLCPWRAQALACRARTARALALAPAGQRRALRASHPDSRGTGAAAQVRGTLGQRSTVGHHPAWRGPRLYAQSVWRDARGDGRRPLGHTQDPALPSARGLGVPQDPVDCVGDHRPDPDGSADRRILWGALEN